MLHITVIFTYCNVLLNKSNCFRTVELHVVQLVVMLFPFDCHHRFDIVKFQFIVLLMKLDRILFLHILSSFARPQVKSLIVKLRLLPRKTSIFKHFFIDRQCFLYRLPNIVITWVKLFGPPFSMQITQFCGYLSKVVGKPAKPPFWFLNRCDGKIWRIDYPFCFPS